jgi:hypothetical protein
LYLESSLVGTMVPCDKCGLLSHCTPKNMIFVGDVKDNEGEDSDDWKNYAGRDF